eukprot:794738-Amphidinium_carterae.1
MEDEVAAAREGAEAVLERKQAQSKDAGAVAAQEGAAGEETAAKAAEGEAYASAVGAAFYFAVAEAVRVVAFVLDLPIMLFVGWRWAWPFVSSWVAAMWSVLVGLLSTVAGLNSRCWRADVAAGARKSCLGLFLMVWLLDPWCYCILTAAAVESSSMVNAEQLASLFSKVSSGLARRRLVEVLGPVSLATVGHNSTAPASLPLLDPNGTIVHDSLAAAVYSAQHWTKGFVGLVHGPLLAVILLDVIVGALAVLCTLEWHHFHLSSLWAEFRASILRWAQLVSTLVALWIASIMFALELRPTVEHMQVRKLHAPSLPVWSACFCVICSCIAAWHAVEMLRASGNGAGGTPQKLTEPLLPMQSKSSNGCGVEGMAKPLLTVASTGVVATLGAAFEAVECPVSVWAIGSAMRNFLRCWPLLLIAPWTVLLEKMPMSAETRANIIAVALAIGTLVLMTALCLCKGKR